MNFEFPNPTAVKLAHLNVRSELHGDAHETALDLKFERTAGNRCLDMIDGELLISLYTRTAATENEPELEGVEKVWPNLRFPHLGELSFDHELTGARVVVDYGIDDSSAIALEGCKVNKFRVQCIEGGSVVTTFRVQTSKIPDGALDKLGKLLDGETAITLTLPSSEPAKTDTVVRLPKGGKKPKAPAKDATQAFLESQEA